MGSLPHTFFHLFSDCRVEALRAEAGPLTLDGAIAMLNFRKYIGHREAAV